MNAKGEKMYVIDHQITSPCSFHETPNLLYYKEKSNCIKVNVRIFHPIIYVKEMEDENAKNEHGSSSRVRLKLVYQ